MADADNHVWIRQGPLVPQAGADAIWEVINRNGQVADRVRVPIARLSPGLHPMDSFTSSCATAARRRFKRSAFGNVESRH